MSGDQFTPDAQRYLDGGLHGELPRAEQVSAERLLRAAESYRDSLAAPDASLDDRVMEAVRLRGRRGRRPEVWRWALESRIRPVWVPIAAAAAAIVMWLALPRRGAPPAPPVLAVAQRSDTVFIRFELAAPGAHTATVAGSFNGWDAHALPMVRNTSGTWTVTVALPVGEHQYQFVVDGARWQPDPSAHAQVDDGFGGTNSVIVVGPKGLVRT